MVNHFSLRADIHTICSSCLDVVVVDRESRQKSMGALQREVEKLQTNLATMETLEGGQVNKIHRPVAPALHASNVCRGLPFFQSQIACKDNGERVKV